MVYFLQHLVRSVLFSLFTPTPRIHLGPREKLNHNLPPAQPHGTDSAPTPNSELCNSTTSTSPPLDESVCMIGNVLNTPGNVIENKSDRKSRNGNGLVWWYWRPDSGSKCRSLSDSATLHTKTMSTPLYNLMKVYESSETC